MYVLIPVMNFFFCLSVINGENFFVAKAKASDSVEK